MILKNREKFPQSHFLDTALTFAKTMNVQITRIDEEDKLTVSGLEEEDIWFSISSFDEDDFADMVRFITERGDIAKNCDTIYPTIVVPCPSCQFTKFTPQQLEMNTIYSEKDYRLIMCNSCGSVIKLENQFKIHKED